MNPLPQKPFYVLRHGETEGNVADITCGHLDSPLTQKGRDAACALRDVLDELIIRPTQIFHSHLSRARDTARLANAGLQLPMTEDNAVAERHFGEWQGMPYAEMSVLRKAGNEPPGGESLAEFHARIIGAVNKILTAAPPPVLIVTHGGMFNELGSLLGINLHGVQNCELHEFTPANGSWEIWRYRPTGIKITKEKIFPL